MTIGELEFSSWALSNDYTFVRFTVLININFDVVGA